MHLFASTRSRVDLPESVGSGASPRVSIESARPQISPRSSRSILNRVSSIFSSARRGRNPEQGIGHVADRSTRYTSTSRSPSPSLDIRPPSGLGRRGSVLSLPISPLHPGFGEWEEVQTSAYERQRCVSTPSLVAFSWLQPHIGPTPDGTAQRADFNIYDLPSEQIELVCSFLPLADIASLARSAHHFRSAAQAALFRSLDLPSLCSDAGERRMRTCLELLVSRGDLAELVRHCVCPPFESRAADLFPSALRHMKHLRALTAPHFDAAWLRFASFHITALTILDTTLVDEAQHDLLTWLSARPRLATLSLPHLKLALDANTRPGSAFFEPGEPELTSDAPGARAVTPAPVPPNLLPALADLRAPPPLAASLVPGRPVHAVALHVHRGGSIHDGLQPTALMSALARSSVPLRSLAVIADSMIDGRTVERVLMAAGARVGEAVEELEVVCSMEEDAFYKLISSALYRFPALRTLRLRQHTPTPLLVVLPASPSPKPSPGLVPSVLLQPPPSTSPSPAPVPANGSVSPAPSSPARDVTSPFSIGAFSISASSSSLTPAQESQLRAWTRHRPTLRTIVFPGGAEWRIHRMRRPRDSNGTIGGAGHTRGASDGSGPYGPPQPFFSQSSSVDAQNSHTHSRAQSSPHTDDVPPARPCPKRGATNPDGPPSPTPSSRSSTAVLGSMHTSFYSAAAPSDSFVAFPFTPPFAVSHAGSNSSLRSRSRPTVVLPGTGSPAGSARRSPLRSPASRSSVRTHATTAAGPGHGLGLGFGIVPGPSTEPPRQTHTPPASGSRASFFSLGGGGGGSLGGPSASTPSLAPSRVRWKVGEPRAPVVRSEFESDDEYASEGPPGSPLSPLSVSSTTPSGRVRWRVGEPRPAIVRSAFESDEEEPTPTAPEPEPVVATPAKKTGRWRR